MADSGAGTYEVVCLSIWTTTALNKLGSPNDPTCGLVYRGNVLTITETGMGGGRFRGLMNNGKWVTLDPRDGVQYTKRLSVDNPPPVVVPDPVPTEPLKTNPLTGGGELYPDLSYDVLNSLLSSENNPALSNLTTRLFGSPFQFTKETDIRLEDGTSTSGARSGDERIGRAFGANILAEAPIVSMIPGKPYYLPSATKQQRNVVEALMGAVTDGQDEALEELRQGLEGDDLSYFDFQSDYNTYMKYVNILCRVSASYMGLGDRTMPGTTTPIKFYNWKNYKFRTDVDELLYSASDVFWDTVGDAISETLEGKYRFIEFYANAGVSSSESGSTSTQASQFEGIVQAGSTIGKEISFLSGAFSEDISDTIRDGVSNLANGFGNSSFSQNDFMSRLLNTSSFILQGANMNFPEIWGDSSFAKSYSFTVDLISPYGDPMSIFLNIIVPMVHLISFALPRQMSGNTYTSPFLVKAFTKGRFSTEMAVVDSISIEKGGPGTWSRDGLPMEMKITISLKDLYSLLQMSVTPLQVFNNVGLTEFLATTCGLDLTYGNGLVKYLTLFETFIGGIIDIPENVVGGIKEDITNAFRNMFNLFGG